MLAALLQINIIMNCLSEKKRLKGNEIIFIHFRLLFKNLFKPISKKKENTFKFKTISNEYGQKRTLIKIKDKFIFVITGISHPFLEFRGLNLQPFWESIILSYIWRSDKSNDVYKWLWAFKVQKKGYR